MRMLIAAIVGLVLAAPGWAATITYLSDERSVTASELWCDWGPCEHRTVTETPAPGALVFDATAVVAWTRASQNSTLTSTSMSGSDDVYARPSSGAEGSTATSLFLVRFRLDQASAFDLSVNAGDIGHILDANVRSDLRVADGDSVLHGEWFVDEYLELRFEESGVLPAGDYELELEGVASIMILAAWISWHFDFTLIPPPPTAIEIDIKPWSDSNPVDPFARGVIPVAILGSDIFDVADVDVTTLAFGPAGASPAFDLTHPLVYWLAHQDVNGDGEKDLLSYYQTQDTGIALGDTEACLTGETLDGAPLEGCDAIATRLGCGIGFELVLLLPPLLWIHQRRRRAGG